MPRRAEPQEIQKTYGTALFEGDYTLQNAQMENLCTCYSTDKNGNMKKGTFERL